MLQVFKTYGFCSGTQIVAVAAENLEQAQYLAVFYHHANLGVPLTPVALDAGWDQAITASLCETVH